MIVDMPQPHFRPVFDVADELGISRSTLRMYCIVSGVHTRLSQNRIMLDDADIIRLANWLEVYCARIDAVVYRLDAFAETSFPEAFRQFLSTSQT